MTAKRFEELICWQRARELVRLVYSLTRQDKFHDFSLKDQIQRAAVSVLSNISEGFERGTREEFIHYLYIAKGSCGEVRTQGYVALDQKFVTELEFQNLTSKCEETSRVVYNFIESMKISKFKGLKYKNQSI